MRLLALTKYGDRAASTRQRFLQYRPALEAAGIELEVSPLFGNDYLRHVLHGRRAPRSSIARGYLRRLAKLSEASNADVIWLHCEFFPYWPSVAETLAARTVRKPIVFDFDDAIFHMYDSNERPMVRLLLAGKLEGLLSRVAACTCGNGYLGDYAARFCPKTLIVPTVVDTNSFRPRPRDDLAPLTIGWIGSPSTWRGVRPILPSLERIVATHGARFLVVGAGHEAAADAFEGMEMKDWREAEEIADIQRMDIGIMPVLDRPFERGKSGYKLIQYMACGLPVIASPVGVNAQIVKEGVNGLLASTAEQWSEALNSLLGDAERRRRLGVAGREQVVEKFSLASQEDRLVALFRSLA